MQGVALLLLATYCLPFIHSVDEDVIMQLSINETDSQERFDSSLSSRIESARSKIRTDSRLKASAALPVVQSISPNRNSVVRVNGRDYSFDGLDAVSVRAPNFSMAVNGVEMASSAREDDDAASSGGRLWSGTDATTGAFLFLIQDERGDAKYVTIKDGETVTTLVSILDNDIQGMMVAIDNDDYDLDTINELFRYGEDGDDDDNASNGVLFDFFLNVLARGSSTTRRQDDLDDCDSFTRTIDVAIAFDSSLCETFGGQNSTEARIEAIVAMASSEYETRGLCTRLRISRIEGFCDPDTDIYRDVITNDNLLSDFQEFWNDNRQDVERDTAHLFSGTQYSSTREIGRAFRSSLCNTEAYGVEFIPFIDDFRFQSVLFAHELGHNAGSTHLLFRQSGNIMTRSISAAENGFAKTKRKQMNRYLTYGRRECLETNRESCGLLTLGLFCPITRCGIFGRLLGFCS